MYNGICVESVLTLPNRVFSFKGSIFAWSWRRESNPQPADYKSAALPLSHASKLATKTRLELVTSSVTGWHSNQLNYLAIYVLDCPHSPESMETVIYVYPLHFCSIQSNVFHLYDRHSPDRARRPSPAVLRCLCSRHS